MTLEGTLDLHVCMGQCYDDMLNWANVANWYNYQMSVATKCIFYTLEMEGHSANLMV